MSKFGKRSSQEAKEIQTETPVQAEPPKSSSRSESTPPKKVDETGAARLETKTLKLSAALMEYRTHIFEKLIEQIDLSLVGRMSRDALKKEVEKFIYSYSEESQAKITISEQRYITDDIINDMIGFGPLEVLLSDATINDIMVNSPDKVFVERRGKVFLTDVQFRNEKHVFQVAQRIANLVGRRVDEASPMVDARLPDGSRVNVVIPPIALDGTSISIRKFTKRIIRLDEMAQSKNLSSAMAEFLGVCCRARLNIIVSGGTGAGKTTLLNALSQCIDPGERVVTIEDSAELRLDQPHLIRLESRPQNIEGRGEVSIRDLVKNALRMRPDRLVIGECRGAETFDMLQAMNTGHDGSMSTLHANSATEAVHRLENLVLMTGHDLPTLAIKNYIADAVNLIVHIARMRDGMRRITQITEVLGMEDGDVRIQDVFNFKYTGENADGLIEGVFKCVCPKPKSLERVRTFSLDQQLLNSLRDE